MIKQVQIFHSKESRFFEKNDVVAIEEPLEIQLEYGPKTGRKIQSLSVTMRTPGNDEELAVGFLLTEGIIFSKENLAEPMSFSAGENKILIRLAENFAPELKKLKRNFYTTSSCGVCGKESIEAIHQICNVEIEEIQLKIYLETIAQLPEKLFQVQKTFVSTGGIHAAAFFNKNGSLISFREDVGRHNALDKLIGAELINFDKQNFALSNTILLLSGRASFELIQKAAMAGVKIVCAIGAPSSLAIETALAFDITLVGFLKKNSCNVYCGEQRILNLVNNENKN
ncbi:formate dehydrogenase accessory sulfurtransferase FdhD [Aequorivita echinoideorum]|uniref:Sulfur carrier protein FdhD n=1 Tax=Aequorivita echinoideorum TaxID=1549647 RepID=A0ABS5S0I2_9FLAO|nr:formate dehydrogenase accessory sulfurtransferase FdhD [Aequorivita echinoideorum]MBT0606724.1 formate dehydrogenase accessory sulfurtransferase FdhD [Aequorivita echinoideorum]